MRVGVVVAHPDDEVLGCGGTLARHATEGDEVHLLVLTDGRDAKLTADAAIKAAEVLGITSVSQAGCPDQQMDTLARLAIIQRIEDWLKWRMPEVVYTHSGCDLNLDHRITFEAVLTATRPMKGESVHEIYSFEIPSSTEWGFGRLGIFRPNVFMDICQYMEVKLAAMACYESEVRAWPHPRSPEALRAIAMRWGGVVGCDYAEVFELVRAIR